MKKRILIAGLLVISFSSHAQKEDSLYLFKTIDPTEIQVLYSTYFQDGSHSAVTGGKGTEKLNVQASTLQLTHAAGKNISLNWKAGIDIITSASTDNIDYVRSSASRVDRRAYANTTVIRKGSTGQSIGAGTGISMESDYLSVPVQLNYNTSLNQRGSQLKISLGAAFDDLRWGRLNPDFYAPVRLVYPSELRYTTWYTEYKRNSFTLQTTWTWIVNKRFNMALLPMLSYQKGLLSTPYHRVYFDNNSLRVENLPGERMKYSLGINGNYFAGSSSIIRSNLGLYRDDFGISAIYIEEELSWKAGPRFYAGPFFRFYKQSGSDYFKPKSEHEADARYYTSDYDLSAFHSIKAGIEFYLLPLHKRSAAYQIRGTGIRISWYQRSDGLFAVSASLIADIDHPRKR